MHPPNMMNAQKEEKLSPKYKQFCLEYLKDFNASAAARRCGFKATYAGRTGHRILQLPQVQAYLEKEQDRRNNNVSLGGEAANVALVDMAYMEHKQFFNEQGEMKEIQDMPEHLVSALQVRTTVYKTDGKKTYRTTYTLPSRIQLMDKLSKRTMKQIFRSGETNDAAQFNWAHIGNGKVVPV